MSARRIGELDRRERRRQIVKASARSLLNAAVVIVFYYLLPLSGGEHDVIVLIRLAIGAAIFVLVFIFVVRRIIKSELPQLQAIEALSVALPLFLVLFAAGYQSLSYSSANSFSEPLNRTGSLYFAIVTLGTVGYGDIAPVTNFARVLVSIQILIDLAFLAIVFHVIVGAARSTLKGGQGGDSDAGEGEFRPRL